AIERGMEVPPLPAALLQSERAVRHAVPGDFLRRGLLWLAVGLAIATVLGVNYGPESATWGLLPIAVGVAAVVAVAVKWGDRILYVGDYDEFWQGNASLLLITMPGWAGVSLYAAAAGFVYWLHSRFGMRDPSVV
ncbi:MAG: hypothetical protein HYZ27_11965, partial [Deltaproteobacteria bacterium]|nr:hypothetical protein [Deltaproteobacteria bacterium]